MNTQSMMIMAKTKARVKFEFELKYSTGDSTGRQERTGLCSREEQGNVTWTVVTCTLYHGPLLHVHCYIDATRYTAHKLKAIVQTLPFC